MRAETCSCNHFLKQPPHCVWRNVFVCWQCVVIGYASWHFRQATDNSRQNTWCLLYYCLYFYPCRFVNVFCFCLWCIGYRFCEVCVKFVSCDLKILHRCHICDCWLINNILCILYLWSILIPNLTCLSHTKSHRECSHGRHVGILQSCHSESCGEIAESVCLRYGLPWRQKQGCLRGGYQEKVRDLCACCWE